MLACARVCWRQGGAGEGSVLNKAHVSALCGWTLDAEGSAGCPGVLSTVVLISSCRTAAPGGALENSDAHAMPQYMEADLGFGVVFYLPW